jgi:hypothetical protein
MIISVEEFNAYTNDYNDENISVKELVIGPRKISLSSIWGIVWIFLRQKIMG